MTTSTPPSNDERAQQAYLEQLLGKGLLIPTGVRGLYGRSGVFEEIVDRFDALVREAGKDQGAEVWRFPPVMSRKHLEQSNYMKSMPQLAGAVHSFCGDTAGHNKLLDAISGGQDWSGLLAMTDVVLAPAACYPCYPTAAARGPLPEAGRTIDILNYCFRHEPSIDPARMQSFRMQEYVRMGTPDQARTWIEGWRERGAALLASVGLASDTAPANDPFFGRGGKMLAANQREQKLKFELLYPITSAEKPTAIASFNYHQDHFGTIFGIKTADGQVAHTACVGFGLERIALALFKVHGLDPRAWPAPVRGTLGLG
jgi:seryl-tRNA synthetase